MKPITVNEIASATGGELVASTAVNGEALVSSVSTDTRELSEGSLFIALRGENFDGNAFALKAAEAGAACLVLDELPEAVAELGVPVVLVQDTLLALQRLAKWYRQQLNIRVIGITGSNGKTSTKDFTASVIAQKFKVNATMEKIGAATLPPPGFAVGVPSSASGIFGSSITTTQTNSGFSAGIIPAKETV